MNTPRKTPIKTIGGRRARRSRVGKYVSKGYKKITPKSNLRLGYKRKPQFIIPKKYQNPRKRQRRSVRAVHSSSGGFFGKIGGRTRNGKLMDKYATKGVTATTEFNFITEWATEMGVITTLSQPEYERRRLFCKAILKKFAMKHEMEYEDENKGAFQHGKMVLIYKNVVDGDALQFEFWDNSTGNPTWAFLAQQMDIGFQTVFTAAGTGLQDISILGMALIRVGGASPMFGLDREMDLRLATVDFYEKCSIKVQNRSSSADGDDNADAVDNVPIYGKIIEGHGCTPVYQSAYKGTAATTVVPFTVNQLNGTSTVFPNIVNQNSMQEPPSYKRIKNATGETKLHLEPGSIKTFVCTYNRGYNVSRACTFMYKFYGTLGNQVSAVNPIGRFTQFYIEKMINVDAASPIRIAVEVNCNTAAKISLKRTTYTQPYFKKIVG